MNLEERRRLRCPSCNSNYRLIVEGNKEGFFQCLQCKRRFFILVEPDKNVSSILKEVLP